MFNDWTFSKEKELYELTTDRSYVLKDGKIRVWFGRKLFLFINIFNGQ